jgi:hypothetical protein
MSPDYYRQTQDALQLNGLSAKTQVAYLRAVRMLCDFHQCPPEHLSEVQLQASPASTQFRSYSLVNRCGFFG